MNLCRTRQRLVVPVIGVVISALLAACGGQDSDTTVTPATEEQARPWTFTDDRGIEISLDSRPQRIVAFETAGSALWHLGIRPVGIFGGAPLTEDNPSLFGVDLAGIESVGEVYGEINLEKLAALRPDLIVTAFDPRQAGPVFGFADQGMQEKVEAIAPIVALDGTKDPTVVIGRFEELAQSLGADLQMSELVADRQRFDEAMEELRLAVAGKPGLRAVAMYPTPAEGISFARPAQFPGLRQLQQAGLQLVEPGGDAGDVNEDFVTFFYESASWEQADKYPADLILVHSSLGSSDLDALAEIATWRALPAVEAGQVVAWRGAENWSYLAYAQDLELITEAVKSANPDLVS